MSEKPISPLRQRMLDDMNMRRFVPVTQREYIRAVKRREIRHIGRQPRQAWCPCRDRPEPTGPPTGK
jgi:hypothetical protein